MNEIIIMQVGNDRPFARVAVQEFRKREYLVVQRKSFEDDSGERQWRGGAWFPLEDSSDVQSVLDVVATIPALLEEAGWEV